MSEEKILERIQRLIAHAEGTSNEAEAANYWAKAQELMAKYAIDEAMARAAGKPVQEKPHTLVVQYFGNKKYNGHKMKLMNTVCRYNRCRLIRHYKDQYMYVIGMESDTRFVELLWTSLILESWRWMLQDLKAYKEGPPDWFAEDDYDQLEPKHTPRGIYIKNWLDGFISRVGERMREHEQYVLNQQQQAQPTSGSTVALALRSSLELVDLYIDSNFGKLGKARSRGGTNSYSSSARSAGRSAGDRADISGGRKMRGGSRSLPS